MLIFTKIQVFTDALTLYMLYRNHAERHGSFAKSNTGESSKGSSGENTQIKTQY
jgi:hypothetical protein